MSLILLLFVVINWNNKWRSTYNADGSDNQKRTCVNAEKITSCFR